MALFKPKLGARLQASNTLGRGLQACWLMNENAGVNIYSIARRVAPGVLTSMASPSTSTSGWWYGQRGTFLNFDGTNDAVQFSNESDYDIAGDFSLSAWVRVDSTSGASGEWFAWKVDEYGLYYGVAAAVGGTANCINFACCRADNNAFVSTTNTTAATIGLWYHVVGTFNDNANLMTLYINGRSISTATFTSTIKNSTWNLTFGKYDTGSIYMGGSMDNVRLYNRTLSPQEVKQLYVNPYAGITQVRQKRGGLLSSWISGINSITGISTLTF